MATLGTYFLDTDSLATATAVWTDATFTVKAPDGWYQACGIVREQVGGFLLPPDSCAYPCNVDCGDPPIFDNDYFGVYELPDIQVGTGVGAIEVDLDISVGGDIPVGVFVEYNGTVYSEMSGFNVGYLSGPYIGTNAQFLAYGFPAGSPYLLPTFEFDGVDGSGANIWTPNGTESVNIALADTSSTAIAPGVLTMYVPKIDIDPQTMSVRIVAPVGQANAAWKLSNKCPAVLPPLDVSDRDATFLGACALPIVNTVYTGPVTGSAGSPLLFDWVFADENGEVKLADALGFGSGHYHYVEGGIDKWFFIDTNSVITSLGNC